MISIILIRRGDKVNRGNFTILQVILLLLIVGIISFGSYFTSLKNNKFYQPKEGEVIVSEQIPSINKFIEYYMNFIELSCKHITPKKKKYDVLDNLFFDGIDEAFGIGYKG